MIFHKNRQKASVGRRTKVWFFISGLVVFALLIIPYRFLMKTTSTDRFCMICHVHPHADQSWKLSTHHNNSSGTIVHCVQCHLPPEGEGYFFAKARTGLKDLYGYLFKDTAEIDWGKKKLLENAKKLVYENSCTECHENLFPLTLSVNGGNAHLLYTTSKEPVSCLNCHLNVGHYDKNAALHAHDSSFGVTVTSTEPPFAEPAKVTGFNNFTEMIPGTRVSFNMIALPGGTFNMGSPDDEPLRDPDEGPVRKVTLSPFWIAETEVTWDEYMAFFRATSSQGRTEGQVVTTQKTDAISGATPPWGAPDQGWGKGSRPAITMSWHAASVYCQWLSQVTGKKYRLPTEAEWEFACRGGTETPYFFEGDPKKYTSEGFLKRLIKPDTSNIASRVVYSVNSASKTEEPSFVLPNPFGLKNMSGNVAEFCLDFYSPDFYIADSTRVDPRGPLKGQEHVIRGGSFKSDAKDVRSAARDFTKTKAWLVTDPQMPKSIWWYSDCIDVGFRVVCEIDTTAGKTDTR
ncbi:MAG TPA: SUMF1/EgtB/PvdO family nonheme iron enzyme [Bacteroidales bacterium]|mgnify:FL=1|nr:SUMF1/EgtB/PvdO family nonheme iron enzyme [Bacteroidales bacterium]